MEPSEITQVVMDVINGISINFFGDIEDKVFPMLNKLIFVNKDIINTSLMTKLIGTSNETPFENSLLILTELILFAILMWYGTRLMISYHLGINTVERPFQFISKMIIYGTFSLFALDICSGIVDINFKVTQYILNIPYKTTAISDELGTSTISFTTLKKYMDKENIFTDSEEQDFNLFSLDGVIRGFIDFGIITLLITYSLRYILIKVLVLISPFAIICMIEKSGEIIFKNWLKAFTGLIFIQTFIAVILIIPIALINQLKIDSGEHLLNKIFLAGAIYTLYKANELVRELIGGVNISSNIYNGINILKNIMKG